MGEFADMAVDAALNGCYWDWAEFADDPEDADWAPYGRRRRKRRATNQQVFARFEQTPEEAGF